MKKIMLLLLIIGISSCSDDQEVQVTENANIDLAARGSSNCTSVQFDLMAGQLYTAGSVIVEADETNVYVTYETSGDWKLSEVHLYVGSYAGIPQKNGNPIPGKFPYKATFNPMETSYTFTIPRTAITADENNCMYVAAHAVVKKVVDGIVTQSETGWAGDQDFSGNNWATYFQYCITCTPDPVSETCETAYLVGNTSFQRLFIGQNWGWVHHFEDLTDGVYTFPFHAGAGNNDLENGFQAGEVTVTVTGTAVNVSIELSNPNCRLAESQVYLSDSAPTTTAPGQYGNSNATGNYNLSYSGDGSFWIIVHGNVCCQE